MTSKKIDINSQELSLNKKLKNVKFDAAFDNVTMQNAEKAFERSAETFLKATLEDFEQLKSSLASLAATSDSEFVDEIQSKAFSVKSRAANGGFPLASDVAKSLFEFCEKVDETKYAVIKLHVAALEEIFSGKFDSKDKAKADKLLAGLRKLAQKPRG